MILLPPRSTLSSSSAASDVYKRQEYDKEILKKTRTKIVTVEDVSEMDEDFYGRIEALYDPDRVLIEWNGMWPQDQLQLPDTWELFQQITIIDGSTFDLYLNLSLIHI